MGVTAFVRVAVGINVGTAIVKVVVVMVVVVLAAVVLKVVYCTKLGPHSTGTV